MEKVRADFTGGASNDNYVRELLRADLDRAKKAGIDRFEVAKRMSQSLSDEDTTVDISKSHIDKWVAPSTDGYRFPLAYVWAWCAAVETTELIKAVVRMVGMEAVGSRDINILEYFKKVEQRDELNREIGEIKKDLPPAFPAAEE